MATLQTYSIDQIGNYLTNGYWDASQVNPHSFNMGSSGFSANNNTLYYNYSGFSGVSGAGTDGNGLTSARRVLVDDALDYLGEILGINFVSTTSQGDEVDIFFKDNDGGAYSSKAISTSQGNGNGDHRFIDYAWVNVAADWHSGISAINSYTYQTIVHEVLHALGLGHPGPYNGTANFVTDTNDVDYGNNSNIYLNDSWQQSVMSYISQVENTTVTADYSFVITPMAADFEALRSYYGSSAFTGDTVYGFNTNVSGSAGAAIANLATYAHQTTFSIIDDGGIDTLDFSGYADDQLIDLTVASGSSTGTISNIGGLVGNMTLAVGTVIENAYGGSGNDTIIGNSSDNILIGNAGSDLIDGKGGSDTVVFASARTGFQHDLLSNGNVVVTETASSSTDTLIGIERIDFTDGDLIYDLGGANLGFTYRIYQAAFGRVPDEGGLRFWTGVMDNLEVNNPSLDRKDFLADQFLGSDEFTQLYGANPTNEEYIDAMYLNVLGRAPDQAGYDFWVGGMNAGLGRDDILIAFAESDENVNLVAPNFDDGVWVA